jgi:hypothetical protein
MSNRTIIKSSSTCSLQAALLAEQCLQYFDTPEDFLQRRGGESDVYHASSVQVTDPNIDIHEDLVDCLMDKLSARIHDRMVRENRKHPMFEIMLEIPLNVLGDNNDEDGMVKGAQLSIEIKFNPHFRRYCRVGKCVQIIRRRRCRSWSTP